MHIGDKSASSHDIISFPASRPEIVVYADPPASVLLCNKRPATRRSLCGALTPKGKARIVNVPLGRRPKSSWCQACISVTPFITGSICPWRGTYAGMIAKLTISKSKV
ncbi:hypothetical protein JB92DRAFT_2831841 [Gautieria morchelliformis]|nr:hypothetical protein JB92DRAFT_2831841 [Gautieria morchelliformis]